MIKYKIKPEYAFFKQIYKNFEENASLLFDEAFCGEVNVKNIKTGFTDKVFISQDMFEKVEPKVTYYHKDYMMNKFINEFDLNDKFQESCENQWNDPDDMIFISVPLTDYDKEHEGYTDLFFLKENIDRVVSEE